MKTKKSVMRYSGKTVIQLLIDIVMINAAWLMALYLFYDMHVPPEHMQRFIRLWPYQTLVHLACFAVTRMYNVLWRYAGMEEMIRIVIGTLLGIGSCFVLSVVGYTFQRKPNLFLFRRSIYVFTWLFLFVFTAGQRFSIRIFNELGASKRAAIEEGRPRVMIVGAGWAGAQLIRELTMRSYRGGVPVIAVDDDPKKEKTRINGIPVLPGISNIPSYVKEYGIKEIVIAIPSATNERMREIMRLCASTECSLKMVSAIKDITGENTKISRMREVNITDLLCRDEVVLDMVSISGYLTGKTVLVTGGGGSIGSELCRQVASFGPSLMVIFDIYENNAYELANELKALYGDSLNLRVLIGSVRDEKRLEAIFREYRPQVVFHAAAHKHVPLMEDSPAEAVKNNIFGTLNVAKCADKFGVERMVTLSTDKAVNPTNVMGATKRVTELIIQYMARKSKTKYMAVRFGNVLGSNGSVIPLFKKQIERGGPVTVTHPNITRYFMTIPEASRLVLQAGAIGDSGRIFVLDMGTPVKIVDLANNLIRLAGFTPDVDIKVEFCGLRPGEKLYEELTMTEEAESVDKTCHDKIMVLRPVHIDDAEFISMLESLRTAAWENPGGIRGPLEKLVPSFTPDNSLKGAEKSAS